MEGVTLEGQIAAVTGILQCLLADRNRLLSGASQTQAASHRNLDLDATGMTRRRQGEVSPVESLCLLMGEAASRPLGGSSEHR